MCLTYSLQYTAKIKALSVDRADIHAAGLSARCELIFPVRPVPCRSSGGRGVDLLFCGTHAYRILVKIG